MRTYPIMLLVRDRLCVVVGAGEVGLRKARSLRLAGARVRLVDPAAPDEAAELEGVEVVRRPYEAGLLHGARLVFACTDDRAVNSRVFADARAAGALVNVADMPEECDFYAPAVVADGDVTIAIGTGGAAPGLAGMLRSFLAEHLPPRIGEFAAALQELRLLIHATAPDAKLRMRVLKELAGQEGYEAFLKGGPGELRRLAEEKLARAKLP